MRIAEIKLTNFRCFGPDPQTIRLSEVTALVGTNASGKTALLHALQRVFGTSGTEREVRPDDFHVPRDTDPEADAVDERSLAIEVRLEFPELEDPDAEEDAVAECFRQMVVTEPGETPFCIIRLEGEWTAAGVPEGVVEQHTYWVRPRADPDAEEVKHEMRASDRARIHLHYVPAARDPVKHVRHVSGSIMARLFKAVNWSDDVKESVSKSSGEIQEAFGSEDGVGSIQAALSKNWKALHDAGIYSGVKVRPVSSRFEDLLRQVEAVFAPSPGGEDDPIDRLSDGQKSLFYLAMVGAAFDIESVVLGDGDDADNFDRDRLSPPSLTIFAVEEPENHIAPHFLGGIMAVLRKMTGSGRAQVLLTSHSPSIMHRIEPEEVRHLRLDGGSQTSLVREIKLPPNTDDAHKFIREAVRAYPELYFARLVVLGEGDSEEIVLPRIAEAFGLPIDQSFVSIAPLGGRHVNHMWRLLKSLDIPHVTLLDFDRERRRRVGTDQVCGQTTHRSWCMPKAEILAMEQRRGEKQRAERFRG
ncbi:MAG: AAA family ATPase [Phycisphaerales bacterium]